MTRHYVEVSKGALFQMVMSGFESYSVLHEGLKRQTESGIEISAHLWGSYTQTETTHRFLVDDISVDTSAKMSRTEVRLSPEAQRIKMAVSQHFGEGFSYLGDFHTHPWRRGEVYNKKPDHKVQTPSDVRGGIKGIYNPLFEFTSADKESSSFNPPVEGTTLTVSIVLTMFEMRKKDDTKDNWIDENTAEFSFGNIKCWLHAQVYDLSNEITEVRTILKCNFLKNFENVEWDYRIKTDQIDPKRLVLSKV